VGQPAEPPAVYAYGRNDVEDTTVYMSWNGATEVKSWAVIGGNTIQSMDTTLTTVQKVGFETVTSVRYMPFIMVHALDQAGKVLGSSAAVNTSILGFSVDGYISE
jgi:hypothetical protein